MEGEHQWILPYIQLYIPSILHVMSSPELSRPMDEFHGALLHKAVTPPVKLVDPRVGSCLVLVEFLALGAVDLDCAIRGWLNLINGY